MNSNTDNMPLSTPLDIRRGLTSASDVSFPLRWGILGAGNISAQWVWALHACEGATVSAVAARDLDRAKEFARQYGVATAYGDYREMVAADDVDIVYIGTINPLHKEHTLLAIEAGKTCTLRETTHYKSFRCPRDVRRSRRAGRDDARRHVDAFFPSGGACPHRN